MMTEGMFEAKYLDPSGVRLEFSEGGVLQGDVDGESHRHLSLTRAFPLSMSDRYIALLSHDGEGQDGREIGMIKSLDELDAKSRDACERELQMRYVVPVITRIESIKQEPAFWRWRVQTDRGPASIIMRNIHEHVRSVGPERLMMTDVDGRRFELSNVSGLDSHSRGLLRRYLL